MRKKRFLLSLCVLFFFVLFLSPLWADNPPAADPLDQKMTWSDARHFLSRVTFGGTPEEIEKLTTMTYKEAIKSLLEGMKTSPQTPLPEWMDKPAMSQRELQEKLQNLSPQEQMEFRRILMQEERKHEGDLKGWWIQEMCTTSSPFTEKMVLFWHNHFTSSLQKCRSPKMMYNQNQLFRQYAKGNFKDFVKAVTRDPAMVIYLDNRTNRKGKPNENFARELMELFTLGEGNYTEQDIKEGAKAFTGYTINGPTGTFQFRPALHEWGKKNFMGKEGFFSGDDIVDIIFEKEAASTYIIKKLWKEFISPEPDTNEVNRLAKIFRDGNFELASLYEALFSSPAFWDAKNRGSLIKSPVELVVGLVHLFGFPVQKAEILSRTTTQLGQNVMDPPNVKGWEGGPRWISTTTLLLRRQVIMNILRGVPVGGKGNNQKLDKLEGKKKEKMMRAMEMKKKAMEKSMMDKFKMSPLLDQAQKMQRIQNTLLPRDPVLPAEEDSELLDAIQHYLLDISFQLK